MKKQVFYFILLLIPIILKAQEDTYHQWLLEQLHQDFDVSGGEWVLTDNETTTLESGQISGGTRTFINWSGSEPFTKIASYVNPSQKANPWDSAVRFNTQTDINKGDALLLVVWMRNISAEYGSGFIEHIFEKTSDPFTKSLLLSQLTSGEWQQWLIPFEAVEDHPAGTARYQINLGSMSQMVWVGGIALINYNNSYTVDQLPSSDYHLSYDGRDENADWRAAAEARIEQHRKSDINVRVVDESGNPVENSQVNINMLEHKFGFGSAIAVNRLVNNTFDDLMYRQKLQDLTGDGRTFNVSVIENALKWPTWENESWPTDKAGTVEAVKWLKDIGIKVRGHNLVWPGWQYLPDDIENNRSNSAYISQRIDEHIREIAGFEGLKGELYEWDVINEAVHNTDLANILGGEEVYADWFNLAAEVDPDTKLFINEYSIISSAGMDFSAQQNYAGLIQFLIDQDTRIDGIGIQCHVGYALTSIGRVYQILDDFSKFGLDIAITEYDAAGVDPETAADYMHDFLTIVFSHPSVTEFLMWGFWDKSHFANDAPLFNDDWILKPSGSAFMDLVFNKWWTHNSGNTAAAGLYSTRGFKGEYEVIADINGETISGSFLLDDDTNVVISPEGIVTGITESASSPFDFRLNQNFPNPFNPSTLITFNLPEQQFVELIVFDVLGREVSKIYSDIAVAGRSEVVFESGNLPSGVYFYRLIGNIGTLSKKMMILK